MIHVITVVAMLVCCVTSSVAREQREVYVDRTGGNDSEDGLSPQSAWQTLGNVNNATLSPGDLDGTNQLGNYDGEVGVEFIEVPIGMGAKYDGTTRPSPP